MDTIFEKRRLVSHIHALHLRGYTMICTLVLVLRETNLDNNTAKNIFKNTWKLLCHDIIRKKGWDKLQKTRSYKKINKSLKP